MTLRKSTDKLDVGMKEQEAVVEELQSKVAENKEASKELGKALDNLEVATDKVEEEKG